MKHGPAKLFCLVLVVTLLAAAAMPALAANPKGAYVVNITEPRDRLNVHGTPCIDDIVDHLEDGTVVVYRGYEDGWWFVEWWDGNDTFGHGYVDGSFLSPIDAEASEKYTCVDNLYIHSTCKIVQGECAEYHIGKLKKGQKAMCDWKDEQFVFTAEA